MLKNKNIGNIKFYFKDITPTTYKKSYNPINIKELEKIEKFLIKIMNVLCIIKQLY